MHEFGPSRASACRIARPAHRPSREHDSSNRRRTGQAPDTADHILMRRLRRAVTSTGFPRTNVGLEVFTDVERWLDTHIAGRR